MLMPLVLRNLQQSHEQLIGQLARDLETEHSKRM